jgi:hypothetical protein
VENKKYKVIISNEATEMVNSYIVFLEQLNKNASEKLLIEIINAIESLEILPKRNPWFNEKLIPTFTYRKMLINKRYLIIYEVTEDTVYVDYIIDCKQDYTWLIE